MNMNINLICLGKPKESYWREAEAEYLKRLSSTCKITIRELKERSFSEKDDPTTIKLQEAELIKNELKNTKTGPILVLSENGQQFSSTKFAEIFKNSANFTLIIGGPLGLDESIIKLADKVISLSPLTFTHQMARVVLWEQVYRAQMINSGRRYHY